MSPLNTEIDSQDRRIRLRVSEPPGDPRGAIQLLHGLAEHCQRYDRFAATAAQRGFLVVTHDHRGHGPNAAETSSDALLGHYADRDGWNKVIADACAVNSAVRDAHRDIPVALFGHSMGSFIAQSVAMRHPETADQLILSGSNLPNRAELRVARGLAWLVARFRGPRRAAKLLDRMSFGSFNNAFKPNRTDFDWLSRDPSEVDRYVADPLCGFVATNQLWFDFLGGLLEITEDGAPKRLPAELPVLIFGGEVDPVGGEKGLSRLADSYRDAGMQHVDLKMYSDGRHEMLNETNRDAVTDDVLNWLNSRI